MDTVKNFWLFKYPNCSHNDNKLESTHTHRFNNHFSKWTCVSQLPPLIISPFIPKLCILLQQAETFHVILNTIPPGLLGHPLSVYFLQLPTSYNVWPSYYPLYVQHVEAMSVYSSWSFFLIIKLTGSDPKNSTSSSLFFLKFILTPHVHLIMFTVDVQCAFVAIQRFIFMM